MLKLLVDPLATGAYFDDTPEVVIAELKACFPAVSVAVQRHATVTFLQVDLEPSSAAELVRMSGIQAVFEGEGESIRLLDVDPGYVLPPALVYGAKYRGKTHELVTLLALNLARWTSTAEGPVEVLDPMAGRGTTLLWAARHGWSAVGVEQDPKALADLKRHVKRQTLLHRIKHREHQGSVGPKRKDGRGRFLEYRFGDPGMRLVIGDSARLTELLGPRTWPLIVADLPYGVQHTGRDGTRNPLGVIGGCAEGWARALAPGGAMVLIFNRLQPRRDALAALFVDQGLEVREIGVAHRMSESIWRDLLVLERPSGAASPERPR